MESFQQFILFSAIIVLIITLIFIGMALSYSKDQKWPPMTPECPDYWIVDGSGNNATCINMKDLGTCPPRSGDQHLRMDFNSAAFKGDNEMCAKYTWAKKCGVSWDGITYGVNNPCQSTTK
jgi:hypothetical protein